MIHIPVLKKEVIEYLDPKVNQNFIDCTIGGGGHALSILSFTKPKGRVLGIDWDKEIIDNLRLRNEKRLILVHDNFANLEKIVKENEFQDISGILLDLGMSSWHLEESGKGFSFQREEPLDMRYNSNQENSLTAETIINQYPQEQIENILKEYGEERFAKRIAKRIVEKRKVRPIKTTFQLTEIISQAVPGWYKRQRIHFATKTFQALRIAVNQELDNLQKVLPQAIKILNPGGKIVVISFHSLEDRIVKNFFKEQKKNNLIEILTKKPIRPSPEEVSTNPRARSAKLRAAIKNIIKKQ